MKSFLIKLSVFVTLSLLVIILVVLGSKYIVKSQSSFRLNDNISRIVVGHSHSELSVNDSIIDNTANLSASGESYFYNYQKLKKVLGDNKQINTVFVEFTNNHVDSIMDDWIWGYEKMSYYLQYYAPFLEPEDLNLLFKKNSTDLMSSYSVATRKHLYRIFSNDYYLVDEIGGYMRTKDSKVDDMIAKNKFNSTISKSQNLSETNLNYLRKMIDFCRDNDVDLFLIRSPQHPLYADLINEPVYQKVLKTQFSDVDLLDFDDMYFPNSDYLDLHHLNSKGALQFTTLFNELIKNDLLNSTNKQQLIDESIRKFNKKTNQNKSLKLSK